MNLIRTYLFTSGLFLILGTTSWSQHATDAIVGDVTEVLREEIFKKADWALQQEPITVTHETSERSEGGKHDFYSEGDYWWPDPDNPDGPYIRKDGQTNPDNFTAHRAAMVRFSQIIGALASAYKLTGNDVYAQHVELHLKAWFIDADTKMNPSLLYAQAIKGRVSGRGIGIIDTVHLIEVAQGALILGKSNALSEFIFQGTKDWFTSYLEWLTSHPYGIEEMNWENNHGTAWVLQVASFSRLTESQELLEFTRTRYKEVLLPNQMALDGSFPLELDRTKPYGYSLFNLDIMTAVVHILSDAQHDLWSYSTSDGKSIKKGIEFLFPYVKNKSQWPYSEDVKYWEFWPVAHPFLVFGAKEFNKSEWFQTWKNLEHQPEEEEVVRNFPIRNPLIWL